MDRHDPFRPAQKTAVVTGASGGIGSAIVARLLESDYRVFAVDLSESGSGTRRDSNNPVELACDLRSPKEITTLTDQIGAATNHVDLLVNGAARIQLGRLLDASIEDFDSAMAVNVRAAWQLSVELCPLLLKGQGRSIVNIGSTHPMQTKIHSFPYNVSKGAMLTLGKALAIELGDLGIRVNSVLPGFIATPSARAWVESQTDPDAAWTTIATAHPGTRVPTAEDVASAVLFLASPDALGISGCELIVDGGRQVLRQ